MRREELVMDILGGLDDSFIEEAMPRTGKYAVSDSAVAAAPITLVETGTEISKKDLRIYWITRALGMAAVVALIVGAVVLLAQNWDKIAVSGNERPGVVTSVTNGTVTPDTIEPDTTDRFEQITDTSMPEPYPYNDHEYYRDFYYTWINRFSGVSGNLTDLPDMEKENEVMQYYWLHQKETPYTLDDNLNLYWWYTNLGLDVDDVCKAIEKNNEYYSSQPFGHSEELIFNPYEIDVLKSGDRSRIAEAFATEYSIIIGDKVFNPEWLYYHTIEDYSAVGITPEEVLHKLDMYEGLGLTDEAWAAFSAKLQKYIGNDLPIAEFDYDDMKLVVTKYEFDGSTMNLYYDVVFSENLGAENERMKSEIPALTFLIFSEYRQKIDTVSESENSLSMVRTITIDEPQDSVAVQCFPKIYTGQITQELWDKYTFTAVKNAENVEPALKEWTTAKKTFDIEYYNPDDLPGMAAGGGLPFDGIVADGAAFKSIKPQGAPLAYSYRTDTFFADSDSESYEIIPDDLMEILKDYSDGDSLKYDLGGELPALSSYTMLDDTDLLEEYGTKAYRVSIEYLVSVSQNMENAGYYVRFYRRSEEYTEIRRIIELLWNKHDSSYPFNVFSVQSAGGENEGLMIVADDSLSMPGEQIDVLAQIKQLLAENGLPYKARVEFVTPEQLRSEWVPIDLCYTDGTHVDLSKFPAFVKYGGNTYLKVDGEFSTPKEVADKLDELGKTNAAKAMRGEIGIDNIGNKTKAETELFDLTPLDPNIMGGYGLLGNDVLIRQNIAGYDIYLYEPRFSSAVGSVTLLRAALTSYFEGRYRLELCIYGDPRLDLDDAKYTVKIYADRENWDDIKTFLETGSNDSVVWQFEDPQ